jgi:rhodanese-related sulfurtransferase
MSDHLRLVIAASAVVLEALSVPVLRAQVPLAPDAVWMAEGSLRTTASHQTRPIYPPSLLPRRTQGVVVAVVLFDLDGRFERLRILESPDAAMSEAVETALHDWTAAPVQVVGEARRSRRQDKLTFYFRVANGRGQVLNPDEMNGNADVFAPYQQQNRSTRATSRPTPAIDANTISIPEIDEDQLRQMPPAARPLLLDVRNRDDFARDHRPGAINVPTDEVYVRARAELDVSKAVVVDCSQGEPSWCRMGARRLLERGFTQVTILIP